MSPVLVALAMVILTIGLIVLGVHIGVTLLATSVLGLWLIVGDFSVSASLMGTGPFYATFDYALAVIPLFVLMGLFANASGASRDLYQAGFAWFGRLPGGLGIVTVVANAIFAAVTGVSIASAAVFSKIAVPQMLRFGYSERFSAGCVAGSSALGMLIPPSIMLIIYGILTNESIGGLFIAGIVPGIVLTINYSLMIVVLAYVFPKLLGEPIRPEKIGWDVRIKALINAASIAGLVVLVLGGMYAGMFTPTEAGAIGCVGALVIMLLKGRFSVKDLRSTLMDAGFTTASVFLLFIGAQMFGRMLTVSGVVAELSQWVTTLQIHPTLIIVGMLVILMLMGTFLDVISILVIAIPIMLPVLEALEINLIWFGILATVSIETGLVTPPFGMSVFVVKGSLGDAVSIEDIYFGSFPFLLVLFVTILILLFNPWLATWLPTLM
jgi:tripartite ATP-independent transporter DctM subunit